MLLPTDRASHRIMQDQDVLRATHKIMAIDVSQERLLRRQRHTRPCHLHQLEEI